MLTQLPGGHISKRARTSDLCNGAGAAQGGGQGHRHHEARLRLAADRGGPVGVSQRGQQRCQDLPLGRRVGQQLVAGPLMLK